MGAAGASRLARHPNAQTLTLPGVSGQAKLQSSDAVGGRLYNFQTQLQRSRNAEGYGDEALTDPSITDPLTDQSGLKVPTARGTSFRVFSLLFRTKEEKIGLTLIGINVVCEVPFYFVWFCQKCYIIKWGKCFL